MLNFPTYLRSYWIGFLQFKLNKPSSEIQYDNNIVEILKEMNIINQGSFQKEQIPIVLITDGYTKESQLILHTICHNKDVKKISIWIYNNIIKKLLEDEQSTTEVKIRIASSMLRTTLNNDKLYQYSADSLINNIKQLQNAILDVQLPFQVPASL